MLEKTLPRHIHTCHTQTGCLLSILCYSHTKFFDWRSKRTNPLHFDPLRLKLCWTSSKGNLASSRSYSLTTAFLQVYNYKQELGRWTTINVDSSWNTANTRTGRCQNGSSQKDRKFSEIFKINCSSKINTHNRSEQSQRRNALHASSIHF